MKMNASEPLMKRRKQNGRCQNLLLVLSRDKQQRWVDYGCCGIRRRDGMSIVQAVIWNVRTFVSDAKGNGTNGEPIRLKVPMRMQGADALVVPVKLL